MNALAKTDRDLSRHTVSTARPAPTEIVISRIFAVPRELLFEVWTDPKHIAQWWGPDGFANSLCECDLRVGGQFRTHLRGPDGMTHPCRGTYLEIVPPARLVFEGIPEDGHPCGAGIPPRAIVTVTFEEEDGETTLTIHTRLASADAAEAAVANGFSQGWTDSLERIANLLGAAR